LTVKSKNVQLECAIYQSPKSPKKLDCHYQVLDREPVSLNHELHKDMTSMILRKKCYTCNTFNLVLMMI